jgi:hypothetical protein
MAAAAADAAKDQRAGSAGRGGSDGRDYPAIVRRGGA